jgi:hypothetical protein
VTKSRGLLETYFYYNQTKNFRKRTNFMTFKMTLDLNQDAQMTCIFSFRQIMMKRKANSIGMSNDYKNVFHKTLFFSNIDNCL